MTDSDYRAQITRAASDLALAKNVLVITGAGLSADSGLPTYRGLGGLYNGQLLADGMPIEQALSAGILATRPEITWKYVGLIGQAADAAQPNAGHQALVALAPRFQRYTILTQNIDGLHQRAGSTDVIEIHGNAQHARCTACNANSSMLHASNALPLPLCPHCRHLLRPNVVLFGEALPHAAIQRYQDVLDAGIDCVLSVGTTCAFPYIAGPVADAARAGLPTIEINPVRTEVSYLVRHKIRARASTALPDLLMALQHNDRNLAWPVF